jgi:hypothetical protein
MVEHCLAKLPQKLRLQIRAVMRQTARGPGLPHPVGWQDTTREMLLGAILAAVCACLDKGITVDNLSVLATPDAIRAVEARVEQQRWSPVNTSRVLRAIRILYRAIFKVCPPEVGARARHWAKMPRRDIWFRVFPTEDYIRGAYALAAIARISISVGNTWGHTLARDAAMLAFEAEATLRLGEIDRLNAGDIRACKTTDGRIYLEVDVTMRKVHRDRIARIFDKRTIELLAPYLDVSPDSAVFRDINGNRLSYLGIAHALDRTARLTVGQKGGANIMRRAGVFGNVPPEQRRKRLGHGKGSKVTKDYIPPRPDFSMALLHQTVTEAKAHHAQPGN